MLFRSIGQVISQVGQVVALLPGANLIGAGLVLIGSDFASNNGNVNNALERKRQIEVASSEIVTLQGFMALATAEAKNQLVPPSAGRPPIPVWVWAAAGVGFLFFLGLVYQFVRSGRN